MHVLLLFCFTPLLLAFLHCVFCPFESMPPPCISIPRCLLAERFVWPWLHWHRPHSFPAPPPCVEPVCVAGTWCRRWLPSRPMSLIFHSRRRDATPPPTIVFCGVHPETDNLANPASPSSAQFFQPFSWPNQRPRVRMVALVITGNVIWSCMTRASQKGQSYFPCSHYSILLAQFLMPLSYVKARWTIIWITMFPIVRCVGFLCKSFVFFGFRQRWPWFLIGPSRILVPD